MLNKNVADYTDFDGKTNKKIVQAPGGASSFSLAWNNDKVDYGPQRHLKKKDNQPYQEVPQKSAGNAYQRQSNNFNYNEPIKVLEDNHHYQPEPNYPYKQKQESYEPVGNYPYKQEGYSNYQNYSNPQQYNPTAPKKYGGEYGYSNYAPEDNNYPSRPTLQQQDSLDLKMKEHLGAKMPPASRPPQDSAQKPSIRIHEQKSNNIIGDNSYNYWKEPAQDRKKSHQSNRPLLYEQPAQYEQQQPYHEKTSVKVHNPPGGKSSFTFG